MISHSLTVYLVFLHVFAIGKRSDDDDYEDPFIMEKISLAMKDLNEKNTRDHVQSEDERLAKENVVLKNRSKEVDSKMNDVGDRMSNLSFPPLDYKKAIADNDTKARDAALSRSLLVQAENVMYQDPIVRCDICRAVTTLFAEYVDTFSERKKKITESLLSDTLETFCESKQVPRDFYVVSQLKLNESQGDYYIVERAIRLNSLKETRLRNLSHNVFRRVCTEELYNKDDVVVSTVLNYAKLHGEASFNSFHNNTLIQAFNVTLSNRLCTIKCKGYDKFKQELDEQIRNGTMPPIVYADQGTRIPAKPLDYKVHTPKDIKRAQEQYQREQEAAEKAGKSSVDELEEVVDL